MAGQTRREREREQRERLIVTAAREMAEADGWVAVTTRRLAERVEYSQPVLYSHFSGKGAIVAAVAVECFGDLAIDLRAARAATAEPLQELAAVSIAYAAYAEQRPALYDAMFNQAADLPFATPEAPPALRAAFAELREAVRPHTGEDDLDLLTETFWSGLHGLIMLLRSGRLGRQGHEQRMSLLINRFSCS